MPFAVTLALALAASIAPAAHAAEIAKDHPVLGSWTYTMPDGKCKETYFFRPDGTLLMTSGDEVAESKYVVAPAPTAKGFYKFENTITKDNGKKDCSGATMKVGQKVTLFLHVAKDDDVMGMCQAEATDACFGPMERARGQKS